MLAARFRRVLDNELSVRRWEPWTVKVQGRIDDGRSAKSTKARQPPGIRPQAKMKERPKSNNSVSWVRCRKRLAKLAEASIELSKRGEADPGVFEAA